MPDYGFAFNQGTVSTAFKTAGGTVSNNARRIRVYEFSIGQSGTPNATDTALTWDLSRLTAASTANATAAGPNPLDPADAACVTTGLSNYTSEPTYAAAGSGLNLWNLAINQRAAYRWIAKDGKEIVVAALTSAGVGLRVQGLTPSGYASGAGGDLFFTE